MIIVGGGAAGLLLAARCARAGRRVLVLEAGPARSLGDLVSSQLWSRRLKWGGESVLSDPPGSFGHGFAVGWGLGGSALHHYAGWPRLHPSDFRLQTGYGIGLDWPIDYETLRPWYDRVQTEFGLSGDAAKERWRPAGAPYPMPPLPVYAQGRLLAEGFRQLGMRVAPAPLAINSIPYRGRAACVNDGWCDAGCPIGALANPLVLHHADALAHGARIVTDAPVARLRMLSRDRVQGVDYVDASGRPITADADRVILAAGAVQNARLLLDSANDAHPLGLGNGSGLLGHFFQCHAIVTVYALFEQPTEPHMGVNAGSLMCQDGCDRSQEGRPFGSYQWGIGQAIKPNDLLGIANTRADLFGPALHSFMRRAAHHLATMSAVCEGFARAGNRIVLDARRDRHGRRLARIERSWSDGELQLQAHVQREGLAVARAAGARESWAGMVATAHALGGTIMGRDPATSVTDSFGRMHEIENLYVAGGGLFPAIGAASPTFTLYALAERTADHLLGTSDRLTRP